MPDDGELAHWARFYCLTIGPIFPVHSAAKKARIKGWPKSATRNHDVICRWWQRWPDANIGLPTGPRSKLFALDIDGDQGERSLAELQNRFEPLPDDCPMQVTGSGRHLLFGWPQGRVITNSASLIAPKIDVRGKGGMILLSPSLNASGRRYLWEREPWIYTPPPQAPDWLLDLLAPKGTNIPPLLAVREGVRNRTLLSLSLHHARDCDAEADLLDVARTLNADFNPPLPDHEVCTVVRSPWNYETTTGQGKVLACMCSKTTST
jgi:putative DNA primase/helicase